MVAGTIDTLVHERPGMNITRLDDNPIIHPGLDDSLGHNINGPSLVRAPGWVDRPLGRYYLYFAHHQGDHIRLAFADKLQGPWTVHPGGTVRLEQTPFDAHVASPDVHVLSGRQQVVMAFHGCYHQPRPQSTRFAVSDDGLAFRVLEPEWPATYWRVFPWDGAWYALAMPGRLLRSEDGLTGWVEGPQVVEPPQVDNPHSGMRHCAVRLQGHRLQVFYSRKGDCPERLVMTTMDLRPDWTRWRPGPVVEALRPETDWEGAAEPVGPSRSGAVHHRVHQLRDPALFEEDGTAYLLYSVAGEHGIAVARLDD